VKAVIDEMIGQARLALDMMKKKSSISAWTG